MRLRKRLYNTGVVVSETSNTKLNFDLGRGSDPGCSCDTR